MINARCSSRLGGERSGGQRVRRMRNGRSISKLTGRNISPRFWGRSFLVSSSLRGAFDLFDYELRVHITEAGGRAKFFGECGKHFSRLFLDLRRNRRRGVSRDRSEVEDKSLNEHDFPIRCGAGCKALLDVINIRPTAYQLV